jgi:seryl-tRNA(Sec) selenium transferase
MIYLMAFSVAEEDPSFSLEKIASLAKPRNIPVLVDAAAEILTIQTITCSAELLL